MFYLAFLQKVYGAAGGTAQTGLNQQWRLYRLSDAHASVPLYAALVNPYKSYFS